MQAPFFHQKSKKDGLIELLFRGNMPHDCEREPLKASILTFNLLCNDIVVNVNLLQMQTLVHPHKKSKQQDQVKEQT